MRNELVILGWVSSTAVLFMTTAAAHHSAVAFERDKTAVLHGTVTEWFWANPHCLVKLDVPGDGGDVVHWVAETQAPANMIEAGWRKNDLSPGDEVTLTVQPAKNGTPLGRIVSVELADGRTLQIGEDAAIGAEYHLSGAPEP